MTLCLALWACAWASGCAEPLDATYGRRSGPAARSVNGTSALGRLIEQRGVSVFTWHYLSPRLARAKTLVWFHQQVGLPREEVLDWLENWLRADSGRTLIYVGRDYDAGHTYWNMLKQRALPPEQAAEVRRRALEAQAGLELVRAARDPEHTSCRWFTLHASAAVRRAGELSGAPGWLVQVDAQGCQIELTTQLVPPPRAQVLLESRGEPLVSRLMVGSGQILLVHNGSWLLNLPLVNHQHRRLAARLVDEIDPTGDVAFLETTVEGGPEIRDEDPTAASVGLGMFGVFPLSAVLAHLLALTVLWAACRFPIFGPPREEVPDAVGDFGRHIEAVGQLLEWTGDEAYATDRWQQYLAGTHSAERLASPARQAPTAPAGTS